MRRSGAPSGLLAGVAPAGFTLVELVVVMVVLAILSVGTVRFIGDSSAGFADTITRDRLASTARFALAELHAAVKDALPGSPRTNGACLEVIPIEAATQYLHIPTGSSASSFPALSPPVLPGADVRAAVAPVTDIYALSTVGVISPQISVSPPDGNNTVTITFASTHQFAAESAANRVYFVTEPVSYCVSGDRLWRYSGYGFVAAQPTVADLPTGLPDRVLVAENIRAGDTRFTSLPPDLQRNALVEFSLALGDRGAEVGVHGAVQVHNVP